MSLNMAETILKNTKWHLAKELLRASTEYSDAIAAGGKALVDIFDTVFMPKAEELYKEAEAAVRNS